MARIQAIRKPDAMTAPAPAPLRAVGDDTRTDILAVARREFAEKGYNGARVEAIGEATRCAKRMIYYYFGSKLGLYRAVLEDVYASIREAEATLELDSLPPVAAMVRLLDFTFEFHDSNPDFVRIIADENVHRALHLQGLPRIRALNEGALVAIERVLARGRADGSFRADVEPVDLHLMFSAISFHRVSNRYTFSEIFGCDLTHPAIASRQRRVMRDAILAFLAAEPPA